MTYIVIKNLLPNNRCALPAHLIFFTKVLLCLDNINVLFLKILRCRSKSSGFKNVIKPCPVYFSFAVFLT